ncbi:hypothetical protein EMPS_08998 [Entomortierella parvispora]|uniref:Uncharacterized protein n=1 Tax=Entomortierella parvispora TaxID=205924 RepID=A0A9P3HH54_9FUNG|nr:hypothetical protein EMPS_08998 [Entomortierella parvispora]
MTRVQSLNVQSLAAILALGLVFLCSNQASAQFGLSVACDNCLTKELGLLPNCAGINLTNTAQQSTPQFHTCICSASFGFNWTTPCSGTSCQLADLSTFTSNFPTLLTSLNITCIKPTPSPTPTPTPTGNGAVGTGVSAGLEWTVWVALASILLVSMVATGAY